LDSPKSQYDEPSAFFSSTDLAPLLQGGKCLARSPEALQFVCHPDITPRREFAISVYTSSTAMESHYPASHPRNTGMVAPEYGPIAPTCLLILRSSPELEARKLASERWIPKNLTPVFGESNGRRGIQPLYYTHHYIPYLSSKHSSVWRHPQAPLYILAQLEPCDLIPELLLPVMWCFERTGVIRWEA
jgi:hypothetical protein